MKNQFREVEEGFVSLEVAKLLKEKGFNKECWLCYDEDGDIVSIHSLYGESPLSTKEMDEGDNTIACPTIQSVAEWLRKKAFMLKYIMIGLTMATSIVLCMSLIIYLTYHQYFLEM